VLVLAIVALEIPLALSVRQRVNEEVRSQARAQADVLAATASDLLAPAHRGELRRVVAGSSSSVRGRVLVVDARGLLVADSAGTRLLGNAYGGRPEIATALRGRANQRGATVTLEARRDGGARAAVRFSSASLLPAHPAHVEAVT
jgi:hypothetical protein